MKAKAKVKSPPGPAVRLLERPVDPVVQVFPSGGTLLDLQNSGGWPLGRMVNIVGDTSTGKTLLAIEAAANFARLYDAGNVRYCETEAALDEQYAAQLGLPGDIQRARNVRTVEDFFDDLADFLRRLDGTAGLYCLDSNDALSSQAETAREITDKRTMAAEKAKTLHELFRRQCVDIARKNCCLFIISQTRDVIGNMFQKQTRSGGTSLDYYATEIVWLHEIAKERREVLGGIERVVGVRVRAQNRKNKLGPGFRTVDVLLLYGYGLDDEISNIEWLKKNKAEGSGLMVPLDRYAMAVRRAREKHDLELLSRYAAELRAHTRARWLEIEDAIRPPVRKYGVL